MTSNLGSHLIQEQANRLSDLSEKDQYLAMRESVMDVVGEHFRPEFINRIDDIVVFHPLGREHIRAIAQLQVNRVVKRLLEHDVMLSVTEEGLDKLGEIGYDPVFGARPLKRAIQNHLENPLAKAFLRGDFKAGDSVIIDGDLNMDIIDVEVEA